MRRIICIHNLPSSAFFSQAKGKQAQQQQVCYHIRKKTFSVKQHFWSFLFLCLFVICKHNPTFHLKQAIYLHFHHHCIHQFQVTPTHTHTHINTAKMLDMFGIFSRGKKSSTSSQAAASSTTGATNADDGSSQASVGYPKPVYPTLMLTDQMLKGDSQSLNPAAAAAASASITSPSHQLPHTISNLSISSSASMQDMSSAGQLQSSTSMSSLRQMPVYSPMDNVPFRLQQGGGAASGSNAKLLSDLNSYIDKIQGVSSYLASGNGAEYSFKVEEMVLEQH